MKKFILKSNCRRLGRITTIMLMCVFFTQNLYSQKELTTHYFNDYGTYEESNIKLTHIKAEISFEVAVSKVFGKVTMNFETLHSSIDSIKFEIPDITIEKISIDGKAVEYNQIRNNLYVYPEKDLGFHKNHTIFFQYSALPTKHIYFTGWNNKDNKRRKQIWSHRPSHWIPYIAAVSTMEFIVTFDKNYKVFSNGERMSVKDNDDGTKTWHYKMNKKHPFFSTCLVIGDYEYKTTKTNSELPLELWYYPTMENRIEPTYRYMSEMFDFLEQEIGIKYPYEVYRQAPLTDYLYGAMETTTATVFTDSYFVDDFGFNDKSYVNVNVHELVHQWFGNSISHAPHGHVWLTEGFATYYAKLFEQSIYGDDYYQFERHSELMITINASKQNDYPIATSFGGSARWYDKGSLVLDMLRYVLGDKEFKYAIAQYANKYAYKQVRISDLMKTIYNTTGVSVDWFFDEWIFRGGEPHYEIKYKQEKNNENVCVTNIEVTQIHQINDLVRYFDMPIIFEVHYKDGSFDSKKERIYKERHNVLIKNKENKEIDYVLFDPNRMIIKQITFNRSFKELASQAKNAKNMIDRFDAIKAMEGIDFEIKREVLIECYSKEDFKLIKSEVAVQLLHDDNKKSINLLKEALDCDNTFIHYRILTKTNLINKSLKKNYEKLLLDKSYKNIELALNLLVNSFPENTDKYLKQTKSIKGIKGLNVRMKWLELSIEAGNDDYIQELVSYTKDDYDFLTRINALNSLKRINYIDTQLINHIFDACLYWNFHLSNTAKSTLKYYYKQNKAKNMIDNELKNKSMKLIDLGI